MSGSSGRLRFAASARQPSEYPSPEKRIRLCLRMSLCSKDWSFTLKSPSIASSLSQIASMDSATMVLRTIWFTEQFCDEPGVRNSNLFPVNAKGDVRLRMDDSTPVESLIRRFMALVRENMRDPSVTVNDLAKKLGVHRMTLNKHFKAEMEMTPGKYLDSIRLQHAMRLLRDTPLSLKEISERSGIINQSYFCRLIREATGVSPGEYREKFRSPTVCGEQLATLDKQRYGR